VGVQTSSDGWFAGLIFDGVTSGQVNAIASSIIAGRSNIHAALAKAKGGRPTRKQPKASLPALEWLAAKRYKKVCLGHKKCRPEDWRLTVVPQFRLRCSAMVAITKRGSP